MKLKNTLFLLIVTIALVGGFYYITKVKKVETADESVSKQKRLFDIKSGDVTQLEIKGPDRDFVFEKQNQKWNLKSPIQVRAYSTEVDGILSKVEYLEHKRILSQKDVSESKLTLADYGLDKPKTTTTIKTKDQTLSIHLGNERRQGNDQYIQVEGDPNIYVVGKDLGSEVNKKLEDYRERSLFEITTDQVRHFEIKNGAKLMEFAKTNDQWKIVQPLTARADSEKVSEFLRQTCGLRAEEFLTEDPSATKQYGLDEPYNSTVKLDTTNSTSLLILGDKLKSDAQKIGAKIKGQNSIVSILGSYTNQIVKPLNDFRDRRLASFNPEEINEIELHRRQMTTTLQKQNGDWKILQPDPMPADKDLVAGFLSRLNSIQIKDFTTDVATDLDKYSLKTPISSITLKTKSEGSTNATSVIKLNLLIGNDDNAKKTTYVKLAEESSVYGIELVDGQNLPTSSNDLRSRVLFEIKKDQIKSATQKKGKTSVSLVKGAEDKWKLAEDSQGVVDETAWQKFLNHLEHFNVDRIVGTALNGTIKQYGLENPVVTISFEVEENGKPVTQEILVGKETAQRDHYIMWKSQLLICEVSPEDYQILTSDWVGKSVPSAKQ
jgi:hypothetical protein